ncbi:PREDICTED: SNF2 domain-containing protein CLASSY 3-like [Lupinus angustifolius]|uniref:SNF2 domain-containing protein CLASSY 3-like n=1 Tax=Lupinus angustifolius TaxID=3871 RepID=UPI00092EF5C7|nr:PREDICTED: SNF2 domain-containing protein CLASSY 3-like [Lupinus angustifolius]
MHCVSARTRSKRSLLHNLKQSTTTNNNHVSVSEVVGLSSDNDEEEYETVIDYGEEEEEATEFSAIENDDDGEVVSDYKEEDNEVHIVKGVKNEVKCGNVEKKEGKRGRGRPKRKEGEGEVGGLRKRRMLGLDILIDENNSQENKCAAKRTRSHFLSKNKLKFGTIAKPICIDDNDEENEEEKESDFVHHTHEEEASDSKSKEEKASGSESDEQYSRGFKRKGHACVHNKGKRHKRQGFDVVKILKDSIYGKGEMVLKARDKEQNPCTDLPIKFSFLHKGPKEAEKSEEALEPTWAKIESGLDGTPDSYEEEYESSALPKKKHTSSKFSFSHKDSKATQISEEENGLEPIWDEMEHGLNDTPNSWVSCHKREASTCCRKKRHVHSDPNNIGVLNNVLQDYIYAEGEVPMEEPINNELNPNKELLPTFPFMYVKPKSPEKSDEEKELDALWAQMDLALYATQEKISSPASQVQNDFDSDNDQCPKDEVSIATTCRQGKHHLILNDEIGLVCAYCLHVGLDIKDYLPPFSENPFGKSNRRESYIKDHAHHSVFNDFQDRVTGYDDGDDNLCDYTETVWAIMPGLKKNLYPHQCEAFEFLWKNLAGGIFLDQLKKQEDFDGGGCIISHAPGTGKTRLTITFLQAYMKLYPKCRSMIIAPKGMLLTWEEEFRKWNVDIPFHNLNNLDYSGKESEVAMNLVTGSGCNISSRLLKLYSWKCNKSILGISYKLFEQLTRQDCSDKELRKFLLEHAGLLVLDEGHTPRNSRSLIWKAVSQLRTKKRIILSGTPFQNNFDELYNTLCLARPKFSDWNPSRGKEVFKDKPGRPRKEYVGKWRHLTKSFDKVTDYSRKFKIAKEVRNMIHSFVHVHKGTILQESLPGMKEFVVILKPTRLQKELLEEIQRKRKRLSHGNQAPLNVMKIEYEESVTAVHPALFDLSEGKGKFERLRLNPVESSKTIFLMELIRLSELVNEKVLVFCQYIDPLKLMASQLKHHFSWTEGREVLHMHGQVEAKLRQASINSFNNPNSKVRVMLASTKACYEGISLVGASRVVLLDVVWNPSVERQAISRAYRLGQKKYVYTYHLITAGTREEEKICRQAEKDQLSELMFFNSDGDQQHHEKESSAELEDQILEEMVQQQKFKHVFEKVAIKKHTLL